METTTQLHQRAQDRRNMRTVLNNIVLHLHPTKLPVDAIRFTYTWGLGGISVVLGLMLAVTGVLLMFRYEPSVERAYLSIQILETEVMFGSLFRAVHHWSANLLVITSFLHLARVFFTGGYKKGRGLNWLIGVLLLLLVLAFNFTGYLLPWDQVAYWAITVSTSLISYVPLVGQFLGDLLLGGPEVGQGALKNFYALHVAVLPALVLVAVSYHFWRVRKDGGISQPELPAGQRPQRVTTIPHLVRKEFAALAVVISVVVLWGMLQPAPLKELADPAHSPNPAKAGWYFLGFQELLLHMHSLAAAILVIVVLATTVFLPRWDRRDDNIGVYFRSRIGRRAALVGALIGLDLVPLMVIADEYWIDLPGMLPTWPNFVSGGLLPLLLTLGVMAGIYFGVRRISKANHSEALVGLYTFILVSLVVLTIIGIFFRGPNMALVLPT